jgi:hypothetical protein
MERAMLGRGLMGSVVALCVLSVAGLVFSPWGWQALVPVSEPSILLLIGTGLALAARWARKTRKAVKEER